MTHIITGTQTKGRPTLAPLRSMPSLVLFVLFLSAPLLLVASAAAPSALVSVPASEQGGSSDAPASPPASDTVTTTQPPPPFVATDEWQEVLPGQAVPQGLHVAIDMQTGRKTARLLPPEERAGVQTPAEQRAAKREAKLAALGLTAAPGGTVGGSAGASPGRDEDGRLAVDPAYVDALQRQWKKMMRDEADEMRVALQGLLGATPAQQRAHLETLEQLVHQGDNARDLVAMGGLAPLVALLDGHLDPVQWPPLEPTRTEDVVDEGEGKREGEAGEASVNFNQSTTDSASSSHSADITEPVGSSNATASVPPAAERAAVAAAVCRVLGSAAQNNLEVAEAMLRMPISGSSSSSSGSSSTVTATDTATDTDTGAATDTETDTDTNRDTDTDANTALLLPQLLSLLQEPGAPLAPEWLADAPVDAIVRLRKRGLFAAGALLRQDAREQQHFVTHGGAELLLSLADASGAMPDAGVTRKALHLLTDLLWNSLERAAEATGGVEGEEQEQEQEQGQGVRLPPRVAALLRLVRTAQRNKDSDNANTANAANDALGTLLREGGLSTPLMQQLMRQVAAADVALGDLEVALELLLLLHAGTDAADDAADETALAIWAAATALEKYVAEWAEDVAEGDDYYRALSGLAQAVRGVLQGRGGAHGAAGARTEL